MKHQDALNTLGLPQRTTFEEIKSAYRKACKHYHPDINPAGEEMMKVINNAFEALQNYQYSEETDHEEELEYGTRLNKALNAILHMGLSLEVCGAWIWVTGNTFSHKDKLKEHGFKFAPQKKAWYFRPNKYRSKSRGNWSLEEIREKHGSQHIRSKTQQRIQ